MTSISVGIPTYRGARTLRRTVDSVVAALRYLEPSFWRIIICVNGSHDETDASALACAEEYHGCVTVLHEKRASKALAMNVIATNAASDLLCFVDDDVLLDRMCLSSCCDLLQSDSALKLVFAGRRVVERIHGDWYQRLIYKALTVRFRHDIFERDEEFVNGSCMCMRKRDYPELPSDLILDDQYLNIFFWGRVAKSASAVFYFHGVSSIRQYCERYYRLALAHEQMYEYSFSNEQVELYNRLIYRQLDSRKIRVLSWDERGAFAIWRLVEWYARLTYHLRGSRNLNWTRNSHDHQL
jgi:glycosyltransferase involved in cell wall biosynthesis